MTQNEFDKTPCGANMWANYKGDKYYIISVDFEERLYALVDEKRAVEPEEWRWVRCENIELTA